MKKYFFKDFLGFNSGGLLIGHRGVGKSQILTHCAMWGFEQGWLLFIIPCSTLFTK